MYSGIQPDLFEQWLPRRAALQVALGIWVAGFAVAGASAWIMHHHAVGTDETKGTAAEIETPPIEIPEPERAVNIPIDVIVGIRTPKSGVAMGQKP